MPDVGRVTRIEGANNVELSLAMVVAAGSFVLGAAVRLFALSDAAESFALGNAVMTLANALTGTSKTGFIVSSPQEPFETVIVSSVGPFVHRADASRVVACNLMSAMRPVTWAAGSGTAEPGS